jgi:hypothetical protein
MKIILNNDEIKAAIERYTREKYLGSYSHNWVITEIKISCDDDVISATSTVDTIKCAPAPPPCAPSPTPMPRQY